MADDIDRALAGWDYKAGMIQGRLVRAHDDRQVIQMRIDLGLLQLEIAGRPDGKRPHGCETYFQYLERQAKLAAKTGSPFMLNDEQCEEADREFVQYYHRRVCWLALGNHERAKADADHTLRFMDFVRDHSPNEEYTRTHEQYRGFVLFHRTQAAAALALDRNDPEQAIDEINHGLGRLREFFSSFGLEEQMGDDRMVQQLHDLDKSVREAHGITETLIEQLNRAVANEEYETAARIRDQLKSRTPSRPDPPLT